MNYMVLASLSGREAVPTVTVRDRVRLARDSDGGGLTVSLSSTSD